MPIANGDGKQGDKTCTPKKIHSLWETYEGPLLRGGSCSEMTKGLTNHLFSLCHLFHISEAIKSFPKL